MKSDGGPAQPGCHARSGSKRPEKTGKLVHIGVGVKGSSGRQTWWPSLTTTSTISTPRGQRLGVTMTVHDYGYSQILTRSDSRFKEGCPAKTGWPTSYTSIPGQGQFRGGATMSFVAIAGPRGKGQLTAARLERVSIADDPCGPGGAERGASGRVRRAPVFCPDGSPGTSERAGFSPQSERQPARRDRVSTPWRAPGRNARPGSPKSGPRLRNRRDGRRCRYGSKGWSHPRIFWLSGLNEKDPCQRQAHSCTRSAALWGCPHGRSGPHRSRDRKLLTTGSHR